MRKVICDGCDGEIGEEDTTANDLVLVHITRGAAKKTKVPEALEYDLCQTCETKLRNEADPKQWHRMKARSEK